MKETETTPNPQQTGLQFLAMAAALATPIMVQNLISTLVGTADTIMLGYVSQAAMSASSLANQLYFVLLMTLNGLATGAAVMGAQYWGRKDTAAIEKILGMGIRYALMTAAVFSALAFFFPAYVMKLFTEDTAIIAEGTAYLRILSVSYLFSAFSTVYIAVLRSMEKVVLPSVVYALSLGINIALNAVFIFGLFGAPKLGLVGVAAGTVTARAFECITCMVHSLVNRDVRFRLSHFLTGNGVLLQDYMKISMPSLVNDVAWSLAASMFSVVMGHMGSDVVAANAVAVTVVSIGAIACRGFSNATTVIVGKALGSGDREAAKTAGRRMTWLSLFFAALGGVVIAALRPLFLQLYADKLTRTALAYLSFMLYMQAFRLIGEGLNTCWICGCFRGGGDTKFGMIVDMTFMWLVALPLMAAAAYVLKWPVFWVYFVMCLDEFEKMPVVIAHYRKYTWLNNITRDNL